MNHVPTIHVHLKSVTLFENRAFADVMKLRSDHTGWSRRSLKSSMASVLIRRGKRGHRHRHTGTRTCDNGDGTGAGHLESRNTEQCQRAPEAGRGRAQGRDFPCPASRTETAHVCCLKPPSSWSSVVTALRNYYTPIFSSVTGRLRVLDPFPRQQTCLSAVYKIP